MDLILLERLFVVLFEWFLLNDRLIQVEDNTNRPLGLIQRWPRLLNRGVNYSDKGKQIRDFDNRLLNTGSTVVSKNKWHEAFLSACDVEF